MLRFRMDPPEIFQLINSMELPPTGLWTCVRAGMRSARVDDATRKWQRRFDKDLDRSVPDAERPRTAPSHSDAEAESVLLRESAD